MINWFTDHSLLCLLALAALGTVFWVWTQRERLAMRLRWVLPLSILHVAVGVGCVKAFAILEAGSLSVAGNMSLFGAVFLLPVFYWLGARLTKRKPGTVFDVFVVPMVFTLACARVNCIIFGCCRGQCIPGTDFRYPTREAELVFYAVLLAWMLLKTKQGDTGGKLYPIYMIAYGIFRFIIEFFREGRGAVFHMAHIWAALCLITGLSFYLELKRSSKQNNNRNHSRDRRKQE